MKLQSTIGLSAVLSFSLLACGSAGSEPPTEESTAAASARTAEHPVLMGVNSSGLARFESATRLEAQVVRAYLEQGQRIPSSTTEAKLDSYYAAHQAVVYSMKVDDSPDSEATNKANLSALARDIVRQGHASSTWLVLHHEPFPELSGEAFQRMYATYAPSIRSEGVRCGVVFQTYPLYHGTPTYAADYTANILADVDFIGIDVYPDTTPEGYGTNLLQAMSPFTSYAKSHGKAFQIDEIAVDDTVKGTRAEGAAWLDGLAEIGSDAELIAYFEGAPNLDIENNPDAVSTWQTLVRELTTR